MYRGAAAPPAAPGASAKELATLDILCTGRLRVGVGIGHLEAEMDALDVRPDGRQDRAMESLDVMAALWRGDTTFHGTHYGFTEVDAYPRPHRPGGPPIVMGGWAPAALRRAAIRASGWYGFGLTPEQTAGSVGRIHDEAAAAGRDLAGFEISLTPTIRLTEALVAEYADAGVHQLVVSAEANDLDGVRRKLTRNAPETLGIDPRRPA